MSSIAADRSERRRRLYPAADRRAGRFGGRLFSISRMPVPEGRGRGGCVPCSLSEVPHHVHARSRQCVRAPCLPRRAWPPLEGEAAVVMVNGQRCGRSRWRLLTAFAQPGRSLLAPPADAAPPAPGAAPAPMLAATLPPLAKATMASTERSSDSYLIASPSLRRCASSACTAAGR